VNKVVLFLSSIALLTASSVHSVEPAPKGVVNSVATAKAEVVVTEASVQAIIQSVNLSLSPQDQAVVARFMNAKLKKELHAEVAQMLKEGYSQTRIEEIIGLCYYLKAQEYFAWRACKKGLLFVGAFGAIGALVGYGVVKIFEKWNGSGSKVVASDKPHEASAAGQTEPSVAPAPSDSTPPLAEASTVPPVLTKEQIARDQELNENFVPCF